MSEGMSGIAADRPQLDSSSMASPVTASRMEEAEVALQSVEYVKQREGFLFVRYSLKLPAWAVASAVKLAFAHEPISRDPDRDKDHIVRVMPSVVISPKPQRRGKSTGVFMTEHQVKQFLWFVNCYGMWGRSVNAYLVVYSVDASGLERAIKVSLPIQIDCPLQPACLGRPAVGEVRWSQPLGQTLARNQIPYETDGCLLLYLDVFGTGMWLFHSNKKLITATHKTLKRGVNCITYADAAVGAKLDHVMNLTGAGVASAVHATPIHSAVTGDTMRAYFNQENHANWRSHYFLMWWDTHVVVVAEGTVCEYARSAGSYRETPVQEFLMQFKRTLLSLSKVAVAPVCEAPGS